MFATVFALPLIDCAKDGLYVGDRRPVDRLQAAHLQAQSVNTEHAYAVEADRVRPARRSRTEDTLLRSALVISRMHGQRAAIGLVQPGEDDDLVSNRNAVKSRLHRGVQDQIRIRSSLIALPRCIGGQRERTLDTSYGTNYEVDPQVVCHVVTLIATLGSHRSPPSSGVPARYPSRFSAQGYE